MHSSLDPQTIKPVLLNCLKHHLGYTAGLLKQVRDRQAAARLAHHLLKLGKGQMDVYHGQCSPWQVSEEVLANLEKNTVLEEAAFARWVKSGGGFRLLQLSDHTLWTLRKGDLPGAWVHIHPGRYARHTVRLRAPAYRTAIMTLALAQMEGQGPVCLSLVNRARSYFDNYGPVTTLDPANGIGRAINILQRHF